MNFPTPSMFASCRHLNLKQRDQPTFQFAHLVQVFSIESVSQEDSCRICRSLGCEHIKHVYFDTCSLFVSLFVDVICLFRSLVLLTLPIFVSLSFTTHDSWVCFPRGVFKVRVSTFSRLLLFVLLIHSSPWQLAQAFPLTLFWTHGTGYSWVVVTIVLTRIVEYYTFFPFHCDVDWRFLDCWLLSYPQCDPPKMASFSDCQDWMNQLLWITRYPSFDFNPCVRLRVFTFGIDCILYTLSVTNVCWQLVGGNVLRFVCSVALYRDVPPTILLGCRMYSFS